MASKRWTGQKVIHESFIFAHKLLIYNVSYMSHSYLFINGSFKNGSYMIE
jgi:hypothetical protein